VATTQQDTQPLADSTGPYWPAIITSPYDYEPDFLETVQAPTHADAVRSAAYTYQAPYTPAVIPLTVTERISAGPDPEDVTIPAVVQLAQALLTAHAPKGPDAVALARAILAVAGDTEHEVARTDEIDAYRARSARGFELTCEVRRLRQERDAALEKGARSMRDLAAQEVLIDTHRVPMAISEAIAALPLRPNTDRPDLVDLPAEDLVEPGDEVPTLAELYERIHTLEAGAASAERLRQVEDRVAALEARERAEHTIDLDHGTDIQVLAAPGVLKGDTDG